jgi:hypothetical protein
MRLGWQIVLVLVVLSGVLVAAVLVADGCAERVVESDASVESAPPAIERGERKPRPEQRVEPSHCPPDTAECAETEGEIFYVEAVDPDGDGDAHFVIWDSQSITLPGLTAIDLEKSLRPNPLPEPGDLISAAGPVQTGSHGQSQIHAVEFHVGVPASGR